MATTKDCTADNPMPSTRDWLGYNWVHHNVEILNKRKNFTNEEMKAHYRCQNCGVEFWAPYTESEPV